MDKRQAQFAMEAASWSSEKEEELYSLRAETKTLKQTMMTLLKGEQEKEDKNRVLTEKIQLLERNYQKKANEFDNLSSEMQKLKERENSSKEKKRVVLISEELKKKERKEILLQEQMIQLRTDLQKNQDLLDICRQFCKGDFLNSEDVQKPFKNADEESKQLINSMLKMQENILKERKIKMRLESANGYLQRDNKILLFEKESALKRLNKIAGIQLTKGNSEIAYSPTRLGEMWSSLYTDEWSEAYDEITMKKTIRNENCRVEKELCEIAKKCYTTCVELEQKQTTDIKMRKWESASYIQHDQLVEAAQKMKEPSSIDGGLFRGLCMEEFIQIFIERRKYDTKLLEYIVQKTVEHFKRYRKSGSRNHVINFVKRCTELCWSMVIMEPPLTLVFDQLEGKPIDKNLVSLYTKNGSVIDFVVWPALILHNNGPILQKGHVQGKDIDEPKDTQKQK